MSQPVIPADIPPDIPISIFRIDGDWFLDTFSNQLVTPSGAGFRLTDAQMLWLLQRLQQPWQQESHAQIGRLAQRLQDLEAPFVTSLHPFQQPSQESA